MSAATLASTQLTRPEAGAASVLSDAWVITQRDLRQRHRHAHHVGRGVNHGRCGCQHVHHRGFGLRGNRAGGQRQRGQAKTGQHVHLVVHHQLLRQALGHVGHTGVVFQDQFHLAPGYGATVLLHEQPGSGLHLFAGGGKRPRHRCQKADFERGALGSSLMQAQRQRCCSQGFDDATFVHVCLLVVV